MKLQKNLVKKVSGGAFDVIGDVRGEVNALQNLLIELRYGELGEHRDGRKLIFVGNLCTQNPRSIDVILLVKKMVGAGNAFSILGKNELHLLRANANDSTGWFVDQELKLEQPSAPLAEDQREEVVDFLSSLPLILVCDGLYIVDTVWRGACIEQIIASSDTTSIDLGENSRVKFKMSLNQEGIDFEEFDSFRYHWRLNNVTSVEYSVGRRMAELHDELPAGQISRLVALRWPEQKIVFESGEQSKLRFEFLSYAKTQALRTRSKEIQVEFQRPGSTMNIQQATEALLKECGYLFGIFEDSPAMEIERAKSNVHTFLNKDHRSRANYGDRLWREMMRERRKREYRKLRGSLGKDEFEDLSPEVQLQWMSYVKEIYPRATISKSHYDIAERLYEKSPTELPRKSWLRKFMAIFR